MGAGLRSWYTRHTTTGSDGDRFEIRTLAKLQQILQCTYAGQPKVFVNAGKGVTIDFDR